MIELTDGSLVCATVGSHEENNMGNQAYGVDVDCDALLCFIVK